VYDEIFHLQRGAVTIIGIREDLIIFAISKP
jgi:hypothetical protein